MGDVVPMHRPIDPKDVERLAQACGRLGQAFAAAVEPFARAMAEHSARMAEQRRLATERAVWQRAHRAAVDGDQGAVLYLLRTPRP